MKELEFKQWLRDNGYQESTIRSRISNVKKIEEAYPDLDSRIDDMTVNNLISTFIYTQSDKSRNREPLHKIEINGDFHNGTATYKKALSLYMDFRNATGNMASSIPSGDIYKKEEFRKWMQEEEKMSKGSADSYISYLNAINKSMPTDSEGNHFMEALCKHLNDENIVATFDLIEKAERWLSYKLNSRTLYNKDWNNYRSGLRKYRDFLEDGLEYIPDEENIQDAATDSDIYPEEDEYETFTYTDLEPNFRFRLMTQNRMSNNKDIFYPISIIRKLFCYSQKYSKKSGRVNDDYDWLKNWFNNYVSEINVITEKGEYPLDGVGYIKLSKEGWVKAKLNDDDKEYIVRTETSEPGAETVPMRASLLKKIHIDHTPSMSYVLTASSDELPALSHLSDIIKDIAKKNRINIEPKRFNEIGKKLFADEKRVEEELLPLIPKLKEELGLLRSKCTLKLMEARFNQQKK